MFLRLNGNPWTCGCEARSLWEWFRKARISSSDLTCSSPAPRKGQDLRFLRELDFALCPLPDPGSMAGTTTTTFSTKTRWWFSKNKPASSSKSHFHKSSETLKAFPFNSGKNPSSSSTSFSSKYDLTAEEAALPKLEPEEYWANYGNEDAASVRCFELECPPGYDSPILPSSSSSSLLSFLSLTALTLSFHLLFGWVFFSSSSSSVILHYLSPAIGLMLINAYKQQCRKKGWQETGTEQQHLYNAYCKVQYMQNNWARDEACVHPQKALQHQLKSCPSL